MVSPLRTLLNSLLGNGFSLIGGLVMCLYTSWKLSILAFTAIGPIIYVTGVYARWSRNINRQIRSSLADANATATEALGNIRTVRAFSSEKKEVDKYKESTLVALTRGIKDSWASA